jgi:hypothetical protein
VNSGPIMVSICDTICYALLAAITVGFAAIAVAKLHYGPIIRRQRRALKMALADGRDQTRAGARS